MRIFGFLKNIFNHKRSDEELMEIERKEIEEFNLRQEQYDRILENEVQKQKYLNKLYTAKTMTFTKKMVSIILFICIIDIQLSYILAFMNKDNSLEDLSSALCMTILGVAFVYMVRAYFDSKAANKNLNVQVEHQITNNIMDQVQSIFDEAGISVNVSEILEKKEDILSEGLHINKLNIINKAPQED